MILSRRLEQTKVLVGARTALRGPVVHEVHNISHLVLEEKLLRQGQARETVARRSAAERKLEDQVYHRCDGLICTSTAAASALADDFGVSCPLELLPNGGPAPAPGPLRSFAQRPMEILYAGGFAPWRR